MVGESEIGQDTDTELGVEVADIADIAHEGEVELVAFAYGGFAAEEVDELVYNRRIFNTAEIHISLPRWGRNLINLFVIACSALFRGTP